ncbi:MAG: adenylate kinase [bacterium]
MLRRFVLLGPPGSGKGTQAEYLSNKFGIPHISTGSVLRNAVSSQTELGRYVKPYLDEGRLVPDKIMSDLVRERLNESDIKNGFILDGFPRTIKQAEEVGRMGIEIDMVIYISVSNDEIYRRLLSRRECKNCGYIFSQNDVINDCCPECNEKVDKRSDDNIDVIRKRIEEYDKLTEPLIDYYKRKGKLLEVDGHGRPEKVFERIVKAVIDDGKH